MKTDVVVIGGGLFGSVITRALREKGREVLLLDDGTHAVAGSPPAACLVKPSWVSGLGREVVDASMSTLKRLYNVQTIEFQAGMVKTNVQWIDPLTILSEARTREHVLTVDAEGHVSGRWSDYEAEHVVLAAGIWTDDLLPAECGKTGVAPRYGVAFLFPGARITQPFISPWAPYRQIVGFNRGDGLWISDGTSLKDPITPERAAQCRERCLRALGNNYTGTLDRGDEKVLIGARPYIPKPKPCYFAMESEKLTVVTGGAKNGTLAAGWCASQILEYL